MYKDGYYYDNMRHMVCVPYSIDNLHKMANDLSIKRCWFHKNHYDIPIHMLEVVETECILVSPRDVLKIISSRHN